MSAYVLAYFFCIFSKKMLTYARICAIIYSERGREREPQKKKGNTTMKNLYEIWAYDENGELADPTRGEMILAASEDEALAEAKAIAEGQGLVLYDYAVEMVA